MSKVVRKTFADSSLTPARKRRVAELAEQPDAQIDCSDIPAASDEFWTKAVRNPFCRPVKQQLTVRLDADVVEWLRRQAGKGGQGCQAKLNALLRGVMLEDFKKRA